jgi:hypothetical protein
MLMIRFFCLVALFNFCIISRSQAQNIPSPKEHFGFNIGDDYMLTTYSQAEAYFKKLAASDRTRLVDIGLTEEGRHQYMLIVSSPANIKNLDRYRDIAQKLAHADELTPEQARALAAEGKAVVWIDGGLHATEVVGAHQLIESMYQFVTKTDPETMEILNNVIILFAHANPDGQELVSDWYMRNSDPKKRSYAQLPRLYQKYIGHDNNRDFFMNNMKESQNISRQIYVDWLPQIVYNHHQTGPAGTVLAGPPYRDPFNYVYDPLLVTSLDGIGAAMNNRLNMENKPGYTQRSGSNYSTWWNGGLRTTPYFHNQIGILTEIIGGPTPTAIPLVPQRLLPNMATPNPVTPRAWHFRQSIDYSVSLNYAVLNYAVNNRKDMLYGIYHMGTNSINNGGRDYWGLSPKHVDSITRAMQKDQRGGRSVQAGAPGEGPSAARDSATLKYFNLVLKDPSLRDPRGYILSADQPDFPTAVKFINALIRSGIAVHKAKSDFTVEGKKYPSGSFIVKTAQAFRPHVLDMFEPQDHPNDFLYPGGPPVRPYDAAGWTLAYSMGVQFDRILNGFDGPFEKLPYGEVQTPQTVNKVASATGYLLDARSNNSFVAVNDLLKAGIKVYRLPKGISNAAGTGAGTFYVAAAGKTLLQKAAAELGIKVTATSRMPADAVAISALRVGLWDTYGGSMPSGWVRWIMEQHHFPIKLIYANEIDKGNLRDNYDVIVFVTGAIPSVSSGGAGRGSAGFGARPLLPADIPSEYRNTVGRITADTSIPQLKRFIEAGGSVVTIGNSTNLAYHLGVPVRNALMEMNGGIERPLPGEKFYIPGSILRVSVDSTQSAGWGMASSADVYFDGSPVFKILPEAVVSGQVKPIAWFSSPTPLRSGWAWGQAYLEDGVAAFVASVGKGKLFAFGPEITFRAQTHGTFKLLFNELYSTGK